MDNSAAYGGHAIGTLVGYLVLYGGILALGVMFGNRLARKRGELFVRWPVGVAFTLVLLLLAGQCSRAGQAEVAPIADASTDAQ